VYLWADGVYFKPRMDADKQCMLVIIGADEWGNKDILGLVDGYRESRQSWHELLLDLKRRGLSKAPAWPSAKAHSASGTPSARCLAQPASNAAGCTRWATF